MNVKNCVKCGKIYAYNGLKYCPSCRRKEEENFQIVKEYIYNHKDATIQETSEATGITVRKIISYLRQGRLEIKGDNSNMILDCERCGKAIKTGRYCSKCAKEIEKEFRSGEKSSNTKSSDDSNKDNDKMYVADRHKR